MFATAPIRAFVSALPPVDIHLWLRFAATGITLSCADLALFFGLLTLGVSLQWSNLAALALAFLLGVILHHSLTFRCRSSLSLRHLLRYLPVFAFSLSLGAGVLSSVLALSAMPLLAKASAMAAVGVSNFMLGRRFVFGRAVSEP
ncbi:MAG TPA: GtrA family protein [Cellvibrionaceae bacterium]